jgi:hypothetical protein
MESRQGPLKGCEIVQVHWQARSQAISLVSTRTALNRCASVLPR